MKRTATRRLEAKGTNRRRNWAGAFAGVRSRLLVWYFFLSICITLSSVWATFKIFCALEEQQAIGRLQRNIQAFQQSIERSPDVETTALLNQFVDQQVKDPNEHLLLVLNGQVHPAPTGNLPSLLQNNDDLIQQWTQSDRSTGIESYVIRVVEPLSVGENAFVVGVYDATMRYQMGETALRLVVQVTLGVMIGFATVAWFTAGRLLAPLRDLRQTAQAITETDLSGRLTVRGTDEIAELTLTFNQMLDRLQAAFTSQQDFIKDVSHELRTPITIIQGHLELLGDDPQERAETIALVRDELKRMNRFVTDLLLLMRAERPNFLRLSVVDLEMFMQELFAKATGLASRNWQLEAIATGSIVCDRQRITQVVMNLAQNAAQYTQEGDAIALGSAASEDTIRIWIRDSGEGITAEDQEHIFDRFARGRNSERRSEGAGLGLSIVQALVRAHDGHIELFSRLGQGSTFTIVLPKRMLHQPQETSQSERSPIALSPVPQESQL
ncbi:HAMP domain-containing sensor histidine kinase [Microcoleus sp. FACHB-1515]|uniref:sensor histidine kinase n=1 Tax=Cyanophyceae TaxID=3028117 RepID=UPI0018EF81AA|nr:HAMP domain-containing sensor histidine kinase [Microcoleus sp. FACHB-1515]